MSDGAAHPGYRADIDGLRAVAIGSVLVFHAYPEVLPGGFVGVDVFFVISGFLISTIILKSASRGSFRFVDFYVNRTRRLLPALGVVLLATFVAGVRLLAPKELSQLGRQILGGATFVENFLMWSDAGYFDKSSELKPLMHLWSLGVEEQFYFVYPVALTLALRRRTNPLFVIAALGFASFAANVVRVETAPVEAFFLLHTRFWELLAGGLLACVKQRTAPLVRGRWSLVPSVLGLALIGLAIALAGEHKSFPGWWALLPVCGAWLLILSAENNAIGSRLLGNRAFVYVGRISYPLYLWHWPLLSFARILEPHVSASMRALLLGAGVVLAALTYRFVEQPMRFALSRRVSVPVLLAVTAFSGGLGYEATARSGFVNRFPPDMQAVARYSYDYTNARPLRCWLTVDDAGAAFPEECLAGIRTANGAQTILVWGDSYAASLYPGIKARFGARYDVAQLTRNSCAPLLEGDYPNCTDGNRFVVDLLRRSPETTVVMFAAWHTHGASFSPGSRDGNALRDTLHRLHDDGVKNVIVVGPVPHWETELPTFVWRRWQLGPHMVPERSLIGLDPVIDVIDRRLRAALTGEPAVYYSARDQLCNAEGCLVRATPDPISFTAWDTGHLTTDGAVIVSRELPIR